MSSRNDKSPGLWAAAAVVAGVTSLGVNLLSRRQQRQWRRNPDPLHGRAPRFPAGSTTQVRTDDGAELHLVRTGSGRPVLLVHGLTASSDDWGPVAELLTDRHIEVIALDQRGHGRSTLGRDRFDPHRLGDDLARIIEALDLHDLVIVGHSMGGMAAQALAVDHPELLGHRVVGLVLISSSARLSALRHRVSIALAGQLAMPVPPQLSDTSLVLGVTALSAFGPHPSLNLLRQAVASLNRCPDRTRRAATAGLAGFDVLEAIAAITVPTVVVSGSHDQLVSLGDSRLLARTIPHADLVPIDEAGHLVIWERPGEVAGHIADLRERVGGT